MYIKINEYITSRGYDCSWGKRCNWNPPRELVELYTHTGGSHIYTLTQVAHNNTLNVSSLFLTTQPEFVPNYGSTSAKLPVVSVGPGAVELAVLKQEQVC